MLPPGDARLTCRTGSEWLRNLFFTYSLVKQAVAKAAPIIENAVFNTGNEQRDTITRTLLQKLVAHVKSVRCTGSCALSTSGTRL